MRVEAPPASEVQRIHKDMRVKHRELRPWTTEQRACGDICRERICREVCVDFLKYEEWVFCSFLRRGRIKVSSFLLCARDRQRNGLLDKLATQRGVRGLGTQGRRQERQCGGPGDGAGG